MNALLESWTGLYLLDPWMLLLVFLLPLCLRLRRWRGSPTVRFAPSVFFGRALRSVRDVADGPPPHDEIPEPPPSWRVRLVSLPRLLMVLGLVVMVFALARPVHRDALPYESEGLDILLCLDISSSMRANDMDRHRTRLEVAKDAASQFITDRPNDRIGLICFARFPDLRCPLTLDHVALKSILKGVTPVISDGSEDATGIGTAVGRAAQVLTSSTADSRVVILLTDGEENVATVQTPEEIAPVHAGQLCEELDVRVYTIAAGFGNPDQSGGWVPIDTKQVEDLAKRTGGRFFKARDAGAVAGVYADIDELERVELEEPRFRIDEKFIPFLTAALIFLLAGRLLQSTILEVLP